MTDPHPRDTAQHGTGLTAGKTANLLDDAERAGPRETAVPDPGDDQDLCLLLRADAGNAPEALAVASRVDGAADFVVSKFDGDNHAGQDDIVV